MKNVVPMRRPNSSLHSYDHLGFIRELNLPIGVTLSVLAWMVFAIYYGVFILGVFVVILIGGIGIGSFKHYRRPSPMLSFVPSRESRIPEVHQQIRRAA
jgi:hypothetical protein